MRRVAGVPWTTRLLVVVVMTAVIVGVDMAFLRGHFWWRLGINVALVALMGALWWHFLVRR